MDKEKKQLAIVGSLVVVMLGVGAFQFTAGSAPPPAKTEAKTEDSAKKAAEPKSEGTEVVVEGDAKPSPLSGLVSLALPVRDPFARKAEALDNPTPTPAAQTPPPPPALPPAQPSRPRPPRMPRNESVAPFPVNDVASLPSVGGGVNVSPGAPLRTPGEFAYRVSGVILGSRPAVVFTDDSGAQKLVQVGSALDGDSRVTGVSANAVTIRHRGKTMTLSVGGTSQ